MIEAWAVLGRSIIDPAYFKRLSSKKSPPSNFRARLSPDGLLRLSRWEVHEIARLLGNKGVKEAIGSIPPKAVSTAGPLTATKGFRLDLDFYAVIGLSCIDGFFRANITKKARSATSDLGSLLYTGQPRFFLDGTRQHVELLRKILSQPGFKKCLDRIEKAGWKSPLHGKTSSCAIGFTPHEYLHVNQPSFEKFVDKHPGIRQKLLDAGVISKVTLV